MKIKIIVTLLVLISFGAGFFWFKQNNFAPVLPSTEELDNTAQDETTIRNFMAESALELSFVKSDVPFPVYFRVGKVTQMEGGENMDAVEDWTRQVNIYHQKELLNGQCSVYEYHVDSRNHSLVAAVIAGLKPSEIEGYKTNGVICSDTSSNTMPKITKTEAEAVAFGYLARGVKNFDQIKDQFIYSGKYGGELHQWFWEDKGYKLPEGLEGRPYSYPTIRITVDGNKQIQYWNTVPLFEN